MAGGVAGVAAGALVVGGRVAGAPAAEPPVVAGPAGCVAVDALVVRAPV